MDQSPHVAWVGTGVMGLSMCGHLLTAGHHVSVFSRTRERAQPLIDRGAVWASSPAEAAASADVIVTMVGLPADVRDVYLSDHGILRAARSGSLAIDMTTTSPTLAEEIYRDGQTRGVAVLDAPVSGGDVGARNATLSIMVGGETADLDRALPFLQLMGKTIVHQGAAGAGQHAKLCNQIVVAGTMIGVCESLIYGQRAGLNLETMLQSIRGGAAACWTLENLAPRVLKRNFEPGFMVDHFVKDMGLALDEAHRMNLELPGLALVRRLYERAQALGYGRKGTHALMLALEAENNMTPAQV
ncbi:MAG: NAD(P)-dependent oxidoreductase [Vicinamibacterales bacterium]